MYRIKTLNKISSRPAWTCWTRPAFRWGTTWRTRTASWSAPRAMHDYVFPDALRAIARAGAGTNNIPIDRCSENGIVVFNTPGANANAVKELVIAALLIASRDILGGADWVQEQAHTPRVDVAAAVEKGKSQPVGPELYRQDPGRHRPGAIGRWCANIALDLGMDVYGYDPFLSVDAALRLDRHVHVVKDLDELYKVSDYHHHPRPLQQQTPRTSSTPRPFQDEGPGAGAEPGPGRSGQRRRHDRGPGVRPGGPVCHRLPQRQDRPGEERHRPAPPGRLHPGERGELRRHGRRPAEGLPDQRQHQKLRQPAQRATRSGAASPGCA